MSDPVSDAIITREFVTIVIREKVTIVTNVVTEEEITLLVKCLCIGFQLQEVVLSWNSLLGQICV